MPWQRRFARDLPRRRNRGTLPTMSALPKTLWPDDEETEHEPVSAEALRRAQEAVEKFPGCFWFWVDHPVIKSAQDVAEVMRNLRNHGGRDAWEMAAKIAKCR